MHSDVSSCCLFMADLQCVQLPQSGALQPSKSTKLDCYKGVCGGVQMTISLAL